MKRSELTEHFIELNFMPQDACRWLSPSELKTLMSSTLALLFGTPPTSATASRRRTPWRH